MLRKFCLVWILYDKTNKPTTNHLKSILELPRASINKSEFNPKISHVGDQNPNSSATGLDIFYCKNDKNKYKNESNAFQIFNPLSF